MNTLTDDPRLVRRGPRPRPALRRVPLAGWLLLLLVLLASAWFAEGIPQPQPDGRSGVGTMGVVNARPVAPAEPNATGVGSGPLRIAEEER